MKNTFITPNYKFKNLKEEIDFLRKSNRKLRGVCKLAADYLMGESKCHTDLYRRIIKAIAKAERK